MWQILTRTMFLFVDIKLHKTPEIHIQNIFPCVKANEYCQAIWSGISRQMSTTAWVNSATFVGGLSMSFNPRGISDHRFSIGFKFGDIAGQSMCCSFSSSRKSMTCRVRSAGPLTSRNTTFAWKSLLANASILVSRTRMYWHWSMFPSSTWSSDFPRLWMAPHIVTPPPPACTLGSTRSSSRASWDWRYSKDMDSSLNTTCCQWPSHQFKCPRTHTNRACRCMFSSRGFLTGRLAKQPAFTSRVVTGTVLERI